MKQTDAHKKNKEFYRGRRVFGAHGIQGGMADRHAP